MISNADAFEYANRSTPQPKRVLQQMLASAHRRTALLLGVCREVLPWYKPAHCSPVRACLALHTMYKSIPEVKGKCYTEPGKSHHGDCLLFQISTPSHKREQHGNTPVLT